MAAAIIVVVLLLWASQTVLAAGEEYITEDAQITGRQMNLFAADGQQVTAVLGNFVMTVGPRRFSGRDAILWIQETRQGSQTLRDITIYIEGNAQVVESAGTTTRDRRMLVTLHQKGELRANVSQSSTEPLVDSPLYKRAAAMREAAMRPALPTTLAATIPAGSDVGIPGQTPPPPAPPINTSPANPPPLNQPPVGPGPVSVETPVPGQPQRAIAPVDFRANSIVSEEQGLQRVTVAKGAVYIIEGSPENRQSLQMHAQAAVLFSPKTLATGEPASPPAGAVTSGGPVPAAMAQEYVEGVYLEGDVVISWGEHSIRGEKLYYDFRNNRAIILDAVLRTEQAMRNIPLYARAEEIRLLSRREVWMRDAKISSSEFYTPSYSIGAGRAYLMDNTPYDATGEVIGEQAYHVSMKNSTFRLYGVPIFYWPWSTADAETGETPLRRLQVGSQGQFGFGVDTQWYLFRLLGLVEPEGFSGTLDLGWYRKAETAGVDLDYVREKYSGYLVTYGAHEETGKDNLGRDLDHVPAPTWRGRAMWRHKQYLPDDWQVQMELGYVSDRNFLRSYFPEEFWAGKEQDTLIYAKKQRDNWAFTSLAQWQINSFQTGPESFPDLGFNLIGQSVLDDRLTLFSESHLGGERFDAGSGTGQKSSDAMLRADTREEVNAPAHLGPVNAVPYAMGRATYWSDSEDGDGLGRLYGGGGVKANMHIWRVYDDAHSRLLDINRVKHVITPETVVFGSGTNVGPSEVFPLSPDIEQHLNDFQGIAMGVKQRWQTYRGHEGHQVSTDLFRWNVWAMFFNDTKDGNQPADGRTFPDRPEYSITRNAINTDWAWNISDAMAVLGDMNYDINDKEVGLANIGLAVQRDPRLRYYLGMRYIDDEHSSAGTFGVNYKINEKYQVSLFQQYDFAFNNGQNLATQFSIIRKWPRFFTSFSVVVDGVTNDVSFLLSIWPEGAPEFRLGSSKIASQAFSELN